MPEVWPVIFKLLDYEETEVYRFDFSPQIPLPGVGYIIWVAGESYKVTDIHIAYDECDIVIFVEVS